MGRLLLWFLPRWLIEPVIGGFGILGALLSWQLLSPVVPAMGGQTSHLGHMLLDMLDFALLGF